VTSRRTAVKSLGDLRRAQPVDSSLRNLLGILSAKLELFAYLPVFEYEAAVEGNENFAAAFQTLAEHERRTFDELLACLRVHLNEMPTVSAHLNGDEEITSSTVG
jgi:hypothetical protein